MSSSFPVARAICLSCFAFVLSFAPTAQADMLSSLGTLFGRDQNRLSAWAKDPDGAFHWGDWDFIQAVGREDGSEPNQQPARLSVEEIATSLASVRTSWKGESVPLFSTDEIDRLAPAIAAGLASIGPERDLIFLITGWHKALGAFGLKLSTTGRVFVAGGRLQLIVGTALSEGLLGVPPGGQPKRKILTASRASPSTQVKLAGDARLLRSDWIAFGAAPAGAPSAPETPPAVEPPREAPPRSSADRLETLKRMHDQGLISDAEYEAKLKQVQSR